MGLVITKGKVNRPQKVVIYGCEGIGKTTLASKFPEPLFLDVEGGTGHLDVARVGGIQTWGELCATIDQVSAGNTGYQTLVIDSADWAEKKAMESLCNPGRGIKSIEDYGYGKGYTMLAEEFARLLSKLDTVIRAGLHVVVIAHATMRKFEQPDEMSSYDRWELKLSKKCAPLLKEWADMVLFCNYQTHVVQTKDGKARAQGGKRVMYTAHHSAWDAKNRHGLPDALDMDYGLIEHLFPAYASKAAAPGAVMEVAPHDRLLEMVAALMEDHSVTEAEVVAVAASRGVCAPDATLAGLDDKILDGWVIKYWENIVNMIKGGR